jgi:hypothetical protein
MLPQMQFKTYPERYGGENSVNFTVLLDVGRFHPFIGHKGP